MMTLNELAKLASLLDGVPIYGCLPASPGAKAGVRYGDILLSVNGMQTPDLTSYVEARNKSGSRLELTLFRDGETFEVTLDLPDDEDAPESAPPLRD